MCGLACGVGISSYLLILLLAAHTQTKAPLRLLHSTTTAGGCAAANLNLKL